jgi:hypothetical protein
MDGKVTGMTPEEAYKLSQVGLPIRTSRLVGRSYSVCVASVLAMTAMAR